MADEGGLDFCSLNDDEVLQQLSGDLQDLHGQAPGQAFAKKPG